MICTMQQMPCAAIPQATNSRAKHGMYANKTFLIQEAFEANSSRSPSNTNAGENVTREEKDELSVDMYS